MSTFARYEYSYQVWVLLQDKSSFGTEKLLLAQQKWLASISTAKFQTKFKSITEFLNNRAGIHQTLLTQLSTLQLKGRNGSIFAQWQGSKFNMIFWHGKSQLVVWLVQAYFFWIKVWAFIRLILNWYQNKNCDWFKYSVTTKSKKCSLFQL